ncbi:hypothetical protein TGARI_372040 [Toxoplasma gondii ARI]|uniref:Uncharacterized protein n=1 Tax=Toxoplasma gondii ARI TaxID=1074872 RepID=A0A139XJK2_TOXGO|nr:hypothetical protein TGARI_372040 [Toxoplasma gondii ARI]
MATFLNSSSPPFLSRRSASALGHAESDEADEKRAAGRLEEAAARASLAGRRAANAAAGAEARNCRERPRGRCRDADSGDGDSGDGDSGDGDSGDARREVAREGQRGEERKHGEKNDANGEARELGARETERGSDATDAHSTAKQRSKGTESRGDEAER